MVGAKQILLTTANARYTHTALGLRCLLANLGPHAETTAIAEFTINDRPLDIVERMLSASPRIIGMGVYIWNEPILREVAGMLKKLSPETVLVLGGPEMICPDDLPPIAALADHIICGEGEEAFSALVDALFRREQGFPRITVAPPIDLQKTALPLHLYTDDDIAHRTLYVETSRGCPHGCEFCLSSLDEKVRLLPTERVLPAIDALYRRGARQFKFVDRTLNASRPTALLDYFLSLNDDELFLHFEVVPDRLSDELMDRFSRFPEGAVQLEAGVQTFSDQVAMRIGRKQNADRVVATLGRLRSETGVHVHSDLVAGLPGEGLDQFAEGFDRLIATGVHEIQVGILKLLRGAPIKKHTADFGMVYRDAPPYDLLKNDLIPFTDMQRLKRFSRYFDLVFNSGNFGRAAPLIFSQPSAFASFLSFSDWLFTATGQTGNIALDRLAELLFSWLTEQLNLPRDRVANALLADFTATGRRRYSNCIRVNATDPIPAYNGKPATENKRPVRQRRRLDAGEKEPS